MILSTKWRLVVNFMPPAALLVQKNAPVSVVTELCQPYNRYRWGEDRKH